MALELSGTKLTFPGTKRPHEGASKWGKLFAGYLFSIIWSKSAGGRTVLRLGRLEVKLRLKIAPIWIVYMRAVSAGADLLC